MSRTRTLFAIFAVVATTALAPCHAAQYGNDSAANARPILADGTVYTDQLTPASTDAWFAFRIDPYQSYAVEVWSPYGRTQDTQNAASVWAVLESDGVSGIFTTDRSFDFPGPQVDNLGFTQGERRTLVNMGGARRIVVRILNSGATPSGTRAFALRVVTTTLAAARWSVNGYNDAIALSNVAASDTTNTLVSGSVLFFDESGLLVGSDNFSLGPNASTQITKANGVAMGGATRGGIRIVHDGAPGAILAQQSWFNPVTGQLVQYPFTPLVHSYGRGGI